MAKVTIATKGGKGGKTHHLIGIHVKKAGNGFMVHKRYDPTGPDSPPMQDPEPAVFTKHAPALKHIRSAMEEMHPPDQMSAPQSGAAEMGEGEMPPISPNPE